MKIRDLQTTADFKRMVAEKNGGKSTPTNAGAQQSNKYAAIKVSNADGQFDSKHESRMAAELLRLQAGGYIKDVETDKRKFRFALTVNDTWIAQYTADASFVAVKEIELNTHDGVRRLVPGERYICDGKSQPTRKKRDYLLVKNLMFAIHGIKILEL